MGEAVVSHPCSQNFYGEKVTFPRFILQCVHVSYSIQNLQAHFLEEERGLVSKKNPALSDVMGERRGVKNEIPFFSSLPLLSPL